MFVAILLVASATVAADDPQEKLGTAIDEGIRLLEAKDHLEFVKKFAHPDDLKDILKEEGVTVETIAEKFGESGAKSLLAALKVAKATAPMMNEDKTKATWKIEEADVEVRSVVLELKEKKWYVRN